MSHYRRSKTPGATYFFTVVAFQRQPILCDDPIRTALRDAIGQVRMRRRLIIDAWVLLPDHLHCIWTLPAPYSTFHRYVVRGIYVSCRGTDPVLGTLELRGE